MRKAVILVNLGGPRNLEEVRSFLYNLFSDPDIFPLPSLLQKPLALLISRLRAPKSAEYYRKIGGKSPILEETLKQAEALKKILGEDYHVTVAMRYSKPFIKEAVEEIISKGIEDVIFFPLYPQFSFSTTLSAINELKRTIKRLGVDINVKVVKRFYDNPTFISAWVDIIKKHIKDEDDFLLFSAHSIPKSMVERGDTYQKETEETVRMIVEALGHGRYMLSYQSKVGPAKWLEPSTEEIIVRLGREGVKRLIVVPISFVCEHSETLYELDIQDRKIAEESGIKEYVRVETPGTHPTFIRALAEIVTSEKAERLEIV